MILVLYTFHLFNDRVQYFIDNGIFKSDNVDFVMICNHPTFKPELPDYVFYMNRENVGGDFGAWKDALEIYKKYDYYIFVNSSAYGPFVTDKKWTDVFIEGLDTYKLFGVSINSMAMKSDMKSDMMSYCSNIGIEFEYEETCPNAYLQTFVFSMSKSTLKEVKDDFEPMKMSRIVLKSGNIGGTHPYYKNIDWKNVDSSFDFLKDMMTQEYYDKGLLNPQELVFLKGNRINQKCPKISKKVAIITSNYGHYDNVTEHDINVENIDWYCFTDNNITSKQWKIITKPYHLQDVTQGKNANSKDSSVYNMMASKYYKMKHHKIDILDEYEYIVWLDARVRVKNEFISLISSVIIHDYKLVNFKHSKNSSIKEEVYESLSQERYVKQDVMGQYEEYRKDGYNDTVLFENGVFIRKVNEEINDLFDEWWRHNVQYSFQDQISYPYVLWKHNQFPYTISKSIWKNNYTQVLIRN